MHAHTEPLGSTLRCPRCKGNDVARSRRRGVIDRVATVFALYPFRCAACYRRFFAILRE